MEISVVFFSIMVNSRVVARYFVTCSDCSSGTTAYSILVFKYNTDERSRCRGKAGRRGVNPSDRYIGGARDVLVTSHVYLLPHPGSDNTK